MTEFIAVDDRLMMMEKIYIFLSFGAVGATIHPDSVVLELYLKS